MYLLLIQIVECEGYISHHMTFCFYCFSMAKTKMTERKRKVVPNKEKPFICGTCGTRFLRRTYLNVHNKKFHANEVDTVKKNPIPTDATGSPIPVCVPKPGTSSGKESFLLEDWSSPDIELLEPGENSEPELDESVTSPDVEDNSVESEKGGEETEKGEQKVDQKLDDGQPEKQDSVKKEEMESLEKRKDAGDIREVNKIYEGRLYTKPTRPMRPLAPRKHDQEDSEEDLDEIQISLRDCKKKRVIFKLPGGKKLQMDLKFQ